MFLIKIKGIVRECQQKVTKEKRAMKIISKAALSKEE